MKTCNYDNRNYNDSINDNNIRYDCRQLSVKPCLHLNICIYIYIYIYICICIMLIVYKLLVNKVT